MTQLVTNKTIRLDYIDLAKGVMILLVVTGHIIQCYFAKGEQESLHAFIYGFHMPLFFLLSGYVMGVTQQRLQQMTFLNWFWHKVQTLLIPYVIWRLFVYRFIDPSCQSRLDFDALRVLIYNSRDGGAWFLMSLFCIQVVCYSVFKFDKIWGWAIPIGFLIVGMILGGSWFYCNPYHYLSFLAGFAFFKYKDRVLRPEVETLGFALFFLFELIYPNPIFLTISLASVLLYICMQIQDVYEGKRKPYLYKRMSLIGQYTMAIYLLHVLLVFPIVMQNIDVSSYRQTPILVITIVISFLVALICVGIAKVIAFFPFMNLILFGKRTKG